MNSDESYIGAIIQSPLTTAQMLPDVRTCFFPYEISFHMKSYLNIMSEFSFTHNRRSSITKSYIVHISSHVFFAVNYITNWFNVLNVSWNYVHFVKWWFF